MIKNTTRKNLYKKKQYKSSINCELEQNSQKNDYWFVKISTSHHVDSFDASCWDKNRRADLSKNYCQARQQKMKNSKNLAKTNFFSKK